MWGYRANDTEGDQCIVHVRNSPHSWNDALAFGLAFLGKQNHGVLLVA